MNKTILSAALAGVFAASMVSTAMADTAAAPAKVKCYGIAKAGKNDCKAADNSHSCKGQAKVDGAPVDFSLVSDAAACTAAKGELEAPKS